MANPINMLVVLIVLAFLGVTGCSVQADGQDVDTSNMSSGYTVEKVETTDEAMQPDDGSLLTIYTAGGTSGGGQIPVLEKTDTLVTADVKVGTEGFATSRATYVYVDGDLVAVYESTDDVTIRVSGSKLDVGTHTVEAIQYPNDDPSGVATLYRKAVYEVVEP